MDNFRELGLDSNMFNLSSPLVGREPFVSSIEFDTNFDTNSIRQSQLFDISNGTQKILGNDFIVPANNAWGTITDFTTNIISNRDCQVAFSLHVTGAIGSPVATDPEFRIEVINQKNGTVIYPRAGTQDGLFTVRMYPGGGGSIKQNFMATFPWVVNLPYGFNKIIVAAERSTDDGTVTVIGTQGNGVPKSLFILQTTGGAIRFS